MGKFPDLDTRFGITRGDVTIILFLAFATLAGFIYVTFFDARSPVTEQREMQSLVQRHDSIMEGRRNEKMAALEKEAAKPADSLTAWKPLTPADAAHDEAVARAEKPGGSGGKKELPTSPININTASKDMLMRLPGIGEKTAVSVIELRTHIPFRKPEDMMNVKGIGEKKFARMRPYIAIK